MRRYAYLPFSILWDIVGRATQPEGKLLESRTYHYGL